ncbi:MAG: response regulator [Opitutales bacterium]
MSVGSTGEKSALVVEDQPFNQAIVRGLLQQLGYEVVVVETGGEGLEQLQSRAFEVALIDCQLPDFDGYELAQRYRAGLEIDSSRARLIALSAQEGEAFERRCREAGMDGCLSKPIRRESLQDILRSEGPLLTTPPCGTPNAEPAAPDFSEVFEQLAVSGLSAENQRLLCDTLVEDLEAAAKAQLTGDSDRLVRAAHRLKGALAFSNLREPEAVAASLEAYAREGELSATKHLLQRLESVQQALSEHLGLKSS